MEMVELGGGEMAMSDFKKAEPILAEIGDTAGLGEVNYAIAELYQNSVVNQGEAVERYRKALKYFEAAGLAGRVADTHLALARMLLPDSVDAALYHLGIGNDLFPLTLDRSDRLSAYGLRMYPAHCPNTAGQRPHRQKKTCTTTFSTLHPPHTPHSDRPTRPHCSATGS